MALDQTRAWDHDILWAMDHIYENHGKPGSKSRYDVDSEYKSVEVHISAIYINEDAILLYDEKNDLYCAVERGVSYWGGMGYHRSTKGNFKRCKAAFERYSPTLMQLRT